MQFFLVYYYVSCSQHCSNKNKSNLLLISWRKELVTILFPSSNNEAARKFDTAGYNKQDKLIQFYPQRRVTKGKYNEVLINHKIAEFQSYLYRDIIYGAVSFILRSMLYLRIIYVEVVIPEIRLV